MPCFPDGYATLDQDAHCFQQWANTRKKHAASKDQALLHSPYERKKTSQTILTRTLRTRAHPSNLA